MPEGASAKLLWSWGFWTMLPNYELTLVYRGYELYLRKPGFEFTPIALQKFASFLVRGSADDLAVFAFAYSVLEPLLDGELSEEILLQDAVATVQRAIDAKGVKDRSDYTFEHRHGAFVAVERPRWWIPSFL